MGWLARYFTAPAAPDLPGLMGKVPGAKELVAGAIEMAFFLGVQKGFFAGVMLCTFIAAVLLMRKAMRPPSQIGGLLALIAILPLAQVASAQAPDRRGEIAIERPSYRGVDANAPIPPGMHIQNEGGSDGQGLCVISSVIANGRYQSVPGLEAGKGSLLWRTAKSRPGGYAPDKLARLVDETMPGERYASYVGTDASILERLSGEGYPIGATMNTGQQYGYAPIHHMISLIHFDSKSGLACVVDNNDPGKYHWMPASEFERRWIDGGTGWAWIWTRKPSKPAAVVGLVAVLALAGFVFFVTIRDRLAMPPEVPDDEW